MIGTTHIPTLVTGIISVIFLVFVKMYLNTNARVLAVLKVPIPAELIIVIFGTLISYLIELDSYYGVRTIKRIPTGMPIPFAPDFSRLDVGAAMGDIFAIAVVTLCISITLGLLFANKNGYALDPNQEFKAQGLSKIFSSFFHCFPSSISIARTAVQVTSSTAYTIFIEYINRVPVLCRTMWEGGRRSSAWSSASSS